MSNMKKSRLALVVLLVSLVGCLPLDSLNPLYTDKDVVFDESLLGFWVGPKVQNGEQGVLEFSALKEEGLKGYKLTMYDESKRSGEEDTLIFRAHLVNLAGRRFLDLVPERWEARSDSYSLHIKADKGATSIEPRLLRLASAAYLEFGDGSNSGRIQANLRRAHWIVRITRNEKKLQLSWPDDDDFKKAVQAGTARLSTALLGDGKNQKIVVTAGTRELQKFVLEHADDETFFSTKTDEIYRKD